MKMKSFWAAYAAFRAALKQVLEEIFKNTDELLVSYKSMCCVMIAFTEW